MSELSSDATEGCVNDNEFKNCKAYECPSEPGALWPLALALIAGVMIWAGVIYGLVKWFK